MGALELQSVQESGQQIVIIQLLLSLLLKQVLAMVFGSILVVQIISHLPLTDIHLPVNVLQPFQILISVVSFDYFPPFEYIDVGFSDVWSYSPNFEWIGYDSINFLVGLGSIGMFAALQLILVMLALMCMRCRHQLPTKWLRALLAGPAVWASSLAFIHGTFFEILVSLAVNEQMVQYYEYWTEADHVSIITAFFFAFLLLCYLVFVLFFVCCKTQNLALLNRVEVEERNLNRCKELHKDLEVQKKKSLENKAAQSNQIDLILQ